MKKMSLRKLNLVQTPRCDQCKAKAKTVLYDLTEEHWLCKKHSRKYDK